MIIADALTREKILEQAMNVVFFNWLFAPDEDAIDGITDDLETVLKVYFKGYDMVLVVDTDSSGDIIAEVDLYGGDEPIHIRGELQVAVV